MRVPVYLKKSCVAQILWRGSGSVGLTHVYTSSPELCCRPASQHSAAPMNPSNALTGTSAPAIPKVELPAPHSSPGRTFVLDHGAYGRSPSGLGGASVVRVH